jgi:NAD(P)-dependent dehydrogenase (short-subunit alcohol dehydrogenase family)
MQGTLEKIALITGANKGIGFEVARQLGKAGCVVLLGARNPALGEDAASKLRNQDLEAQFIELDLRRRETIQEAAGFIGSEFQRLDILVNNAGIADLAADGPPSTADIEAVQRIIQTNFLGTLAVTQSMLPLMRKSESGRVVNVSSGLGSLTRNGQPDWDFASYTLLGYSASKAAATCSTVGMDKDVMRRLLNHAGIPTVKFRVITTKNARETRFAEFGAGARLTDSRRRCVQHSTMTKSY